MGVCNEFLVYVLFRLGICLHGYSHAQEEREDDSFGRSFSHVGVLFTNVKLIS